MTYMVRPVMELGGYAPVLVCADARIKVLTKTITQLKRSVPREAAAAGPLNGRVISLAAKTPVVGKSIADKVGGMFGTFDLSSGLALDIVADIKDPDVSKKLEDGIGQPA